MVLSNWAPACKLDVLRERAEMLSAIRAYFQKQNVLEVETPCLGYTVGTDPNLDFFVSRLEFSAANQQPLYLQTSPEFTMKRLLAAGSGSIYQICKAFRNGESGRYHNPEFTILEWYRLGISLHELMDDIELLFRTILSSTVSIGNAERMSYRKVFLHHCGIDPLTSDIAAFSRCAQQQGLSGALAICGDDRSNWQDFLFNHRVQPEIGQNGLTFIFDYPANQASLARIRQGEVDVAERVEVFLQGIELANGFCELTDADEQESRFDQELKRRRMMGKTLPRKDHRLLAALKAGLPNCSGVAVGLDRVLMLAVGANSIDDILAFPVNRA